MLQKEPSWAILFYPNGENSAVSYSIGLVFVLKHVYLTLNKYLTLKYENLTLKFVC